MTIISDSITVGPTLGWLVGLVGLTSPSMLLTYHVGFGLVSFVFVSAFQSRRTVRLEKTLEVFFTYVARLGKGFVYTRLPPRDSTIRRMQCVMRASPPILRFVRTKRGIGRQPVLRPILPRSGVALSHTSPVSTLPNVKTSLVPAILCRSNISTRSLGQSLW